MSTARAWWKVYYRTLRIVRREAHKATMDMLIYGTGAVSVSAEGDIKHVPMQSMLLEKRGEEWILTNPKEVADMICMSYKLATGHHSIFKTNSAK